MDDVKENTTGLKKQIAGEDWQYDAARDVEIVVNIRADQAFALELLENERRQQGPDQDVRSMLVRDALDLLIERDIKVVRLPGNKKLKD